MRQSKLFQPYYSEGFRCIGPACEDSCCEEWTVHVDQSTFEKYQNLPAGPLRTIIDESILRTPEQASANGGSAAATFAQIPCASALCFLRTVFAGSRRNTARSFFPTHAPIIRA